MPRGGRRAGAGRPKQRKNDATIAKGVVTAGGVDLIEQAAQSLGPDYTAVELLRAIYRNAALPGDVRFMAAVKAAPFETAKPTANKGAGATMINFSFGRHGKSA